MITYTESGEAADEAALITAIATAAALSSRWIVDSAGTTPAGTVLFQSDGEDGDRRIVGGIRDDGARSIIGKGGADIDRDSIKNALIGAYTNDDTTGPGNAVESEAPPTNWPIRDIGSTYLYTLSVSRDAITCHVYYESSAFPAQAVWGIGSGLPNAPWSERWAKSRIRSITAVPATTRVLIELEDDIEALWKDDDHPADFVTLKPLFQSISGAGMPSGDFAMVERAEIFPTSLTTNGSGRTEFEVDAQGGVKLFVAGGRYDSLRGVGDIVRMHEEPNYVLCGGSRNNTTPFTGSLGAVRLSWDKFGGQSATLQARISNTRSKHETVGTAGRANPDPVSNRFDWGELHLLVETSVQNLVGTLGEGRGLVGSMPGQIWTAHNAQADRDLYEIDGNASRRYSQMPIPSSAATGMREPTHVDGTDICWAHGPGF